MTPLGLAVSRAFARLRAPSSTFAVPQAEPGGGPPALLPSRELVPVGEQQGRFPAERPRRLAAARRAPCGLGFIMIVLLPTAFAGLYNFALAADQYVAEFRFTLGSAKPARPNPLSLLTGTVAQPSAALESHVLVQYIDSRAMLDRIGRSLDLRRMFASPAADWWSRLSEPAPVEALVRYWKGQVDPFYDPATGTVSVRVRAFTPQDALHLAQAIVTCSEQLVNDLSQRARRDALHEAEAEVARSQQRLHAVLAKIAAFRDRSGLIDPDREAAQTGRIADRLHEELVRAKAQLATLETYMSADAPSVGVLRARIRSLEDQHRHLAREMTGGGAKRPATLSSLLGGYDELESERRFADAAYQHALAGLDTARANADRQQVYIASFIPPSLPEEPLYPRRWRAVGTVALMAFAVWGIGGLALRSVRDHLS